MVKGYFKRTDSTPIRLRPDINGPVLLINPGDTIIGDISVYKDVVGFEFIGYESRVSFNADQTQTVEKKIQTEDNGLSIIQVNYIGERKTQIIETTEYNEMSKEEVLAEARAISNKEWFVMSKEKIKSYLNKLEIDYSQIADSKLDLQKFLKGKIKEL